MIRNAWLKIAFLLAVGLVSACGVTDGAANSSTSTPSTTLSETTTTTNEPAVSSTTVGASDTTTTRPNRFDQTLLCNKYLGYQAGDGLDAFSAALPEPAPDEILSAISLLNGDTEGDIDDLYGAQDILTTQNSASY